MDEIKKYIKLSEETEKRTKKNYLEISLYYQKDNGYKNFPRGYYVDIRPVQRDGYMISFELFNSANTTKCIKQVTRASKKAEAEAVQTAKTILKNLVQEMLEKNNMELDTSENLDSIELIA